jgi:hypothetical protein
MVKYPRQPRLFSDGKLAVLDNAGIEVAGIFVLVVA